MKSLRSSHRWLAMLCLIWASTIWGQGDYLKVGERVPKEWVDYLAKNAEKIGNQIQETRKPIIIEFWNHACLACIKSFPKIDSLQKSFGHQIHLILANKEPSDSTDRFFLKRKLITRPRVPMISGDTFLTQRLPKAGFPFTVWIDSTRTIKYITHGLYLDEQNIRDFIAGIPVTMQDATREIFYGSILNYCRKKEIVTQSLFFSYIGRCKDDLNVGNMTFSRVGDSALTITSNCSSVVQLYIRAYNEGQKRNLNKDTDVILKVDDPSKYVRPSDQKIAVGWEKDHAYNYELVLPISKKSEAFQIMQDDLRRYFSLKVTLKKEKVGRLERDVLILEK